MLHFASKMFQRTALQERAPALFRILRQSFAWRLCRSGSQLSEFRYGMRNPLVFRGYMVCGFVNSGLKCETVRCSRMYSKSEFWKHPFLYMQHTGSTSATPRTTRAPKLRSFPFELRAFRISRFADPLSNAWLRGLLLGFPLASRPGDSVPPWL